MCVTKDVRCTGISLSPPGCCTCGCGFAFRRFLSPHEERQCLENYRDQLSKELAGVEERIKKSQGE